MGIIHPSLFFVNFAVFGKILWLNMVKHPSLRRWLFCIVLVPVMLIYWSLLFVGRILDEILFFPYRWHEVKSPLYIISNPRSGTTFLHRLFNLDDKRFCTPLLYHTLFPCIFWIRLFDTIALIDSKIGGPLHTLLGWIERKVFKGWRDVHPMGFTMPEEDENLFVSTMISPALILACPFVKELPELRFVDTMPQRTQKSLRIFYKNSLQRMHYAMDPSKTLLVKNVFNTGRLQWLMETFPDAKVIYPVRHPYKFVPSVVSMFTGPWRLHSPDIIDDSDECRDFAQLAIDYCAYMQKIRPSFARNRFFVIDYQFIKENPHQVILDLYHQMDLDLPVEVQTDLLEISKGNKTYTSKHHYSLAQYGMTKSDVHQQLVEVFNEFEFEA